MHSRLTLRAAACVPLLAAVLSAPIAAIAAGWTPPTQLAATTLTNLPTNTASVAVGPGGESVAVWINEANYAVQYAVQSAAGVWSAGKALYSASVTNAETTSSARVVIGPDGTATAIFGSIVPGKIQYCVVGTRVVRCRGPATAYAKIATLAPGATAWTKANLSTKGIVVDATQIALDQNGRATALWTQVAAAGAPTAIQSSTRDASGTWTAPVDLHTTSNRVSESALAVGAGGAAVAAWQESAAVAPTGYAIRSRYSSGPGIWDAAQDVAAGLPAQSWSLRAAVDGDGQAVLSWSNDYRVQWSNRSATSPWAVPATVRSSPANNYGATGPFSAYALDLANNPQGDFLLAWLENEIASGLWTVQSQLIRRDGQVLASATEADSLSYPRAALGNDGLSGKVGWVNNYDGLAYAASVAPAANAWAAAQTIGPALWGTEVALGSGAAGTASAVVVANTATRYKYKFTGSAYR